MKSLKDLFWEGGKFIKKIQKYFCKAEYDENIKEYILRRFLRSGELG